MCISALSHKELLYGVSPLSLGGTPTSTKSLEYREFNRSLESIHVACKSITDVYIDNIDLANRLRRIIFKI